MEEVEEIENKGKIKHKKVFYDNIWFDSKLEVAVYKVLRKKGLQPDYNKHSFELLPAFKPTVLFYKRGKDRKTHKNVFKPDMAKIQNQSYTPDFIFNWRGWYIIVEVKGHPNERYPMVKKMFRKWLEEHQKNTNTIFMEVHTAREIDKALDNLTEYEKTK